MNRADDLPRAAMIFAAGFGTRMGALTTHQPKPLVPVAGRALIDHTLDLTADLTGPIVANLHYLPDLLEQHLAGTGVITLHETPEILETGGGLRNALPVLGSSPVFTLNSDAIWAGPNPISLLRAAWRPEMEALLICVPPSAAIGHTGQGDFIADGNGRARRGPGLIYGGAQIIRTDGLGDIAQTAFSLNLMWDQMIDRGGLYILCYPGEWCDVGHPDGIRQAEEMLARHV